MAFEFKFPDVGEGIQEGKIVSWKVKLGDTVKADQTLGEIETDKAVVEIPSPRAGKILKIYPKEGDVVKVGDVLIEIEEEERKKYGSVVGTLEEAPTEKKEIKKIEIRRAVGEVPKTGEILALPAIRKMATERGIDLASVQGTGPGGRILPGDLKVIEGIKTAEAPKETTVPKVTKKYDMWGYVDREPLVGMRKAIADHMVESAFTAVHVTHMDEIDTTRLFEIREREKLVAKEKGIKLTYLPFMMKTVIAALKEHPRMASSLEGKEIIYKKYFNIGFAVDTGDGLVVPVIKGADKKSMLEIAKEIEDLSEKARSRKISMMDMKGGTITITNVGSLGGTHFTPIINYPECAIVGFGTMADKPVVIDGEIKIRKILPLSISFDHRIVDGAECARFANVLKKHLGDPDLLKQSFI